MGTWDALGNTNVPPELRNSDSLQRGYDFFDEAYRLGATPTDITVNVYLTGARTAADLGLRDGTSYEQVARRSAMVVHGLEGSMIRRESGQLAAERGGWVYQQTYTDRLMELADDPYKLRIIDFQLGGAYGKPSGDAEEMLVALADAVDTLKSEEDDIDGMARFFSDMVRMDQLQWYQVGKIGEACIAAWEQAGGESIGEVTVTLPAEQLAIIYKLGALGLPAVNFDYATRDIDPDNNAEINTYGLVIRDGIIPAELIS